MLVCEKLPRKADLVSYVENLYLFPLGVVLFPISQDRERFQMLMLTKQSRAVATHPDGKYEAMISCVESQVAPSEPCRQDEKSY